MVVNPGSKASWLEAVEHLSPDECRPPPGVWYPFFEDPGSALEARLSRWSMGPDSGYGPFNDLSRQVPDGWPKGACYCYEKLAAGYFHASAMALFETRPPSRLMSVLPNLARVDVRHKLEICRVLVYTDKLQAEVQAQVGHLELRFYDMSWLSYFHHYRAGSRIEFSLVGLALTAEKIDPQPFDVVEPKWLDAMLKDTADFPFRTNAEGQRVVTLETQGLATLLSDDEKPCFYSFTGAVAQVRPVPDIFGQHAWLATVTVARALECTEPEPDDLALDILITRQVWGDAPMVQVGDDLAGCLWLQGCLTGL